MTSINEKMGLRPRTRRRAATHAPSLVSHAKCPICRCGHVVENRIRGVVKRLCGHCGHLWEPGDGDHNG